MRARAPEDGPALREERRALDEAEKRYRELEARYQAVTEEQPAS